MFYAGPLCDQGRKIRIAVFSDEQCLEHDASKRVEDYLRTDEGQWMKLSYHLLSQTFSGECTASCLNEHADIPFDNRRRLEQEEPLMNYMCDELITSAIDSEEDTSMPSQLPSSATLLTTVANVSQKDNESQVSQNEIGIVAPQEPSNTIVAPLEPTNNNSNSSNNHNDINYDNNNNNNNNFVPSESLSIKKPANSSSETPSDTLAIDSNEDKYLPFQPPTQTTTLATVTNRGQSDDGGIVDGGAVVDNSAETNQVFQNGTGIVVPQVPSNTSFTPTESTLVPSESPRKNPSNSPSETTSSIPYEEDISLAEAEEDYSSQSPGLLLLSHYCLILTVLFACTLS